MYYSACFFSLKMDASKGNLLRSGRKEGCQSCHRRRMDEEGKKNKKERMMGVGNGVLIRDNA